MVFPSAKRNIVVVPFQLAPANPTNKVEYCGLHLEILMPTILVDCVPANLSATPYSLQV